MALRRLYQIAAARETQAGVTATLAAADADIQVIDPTLTYAPEFYERGNINRASLSPLQPLAGATPAELQFQVEMCGTTRTWDLSDTEGGEPQWGKFLEACGMKAVKHVKVTIGAVTNGPFFHGETVTGATAGADAGTVIHDTYSGQGYILMDLRSDLTTEVLTGDISGATATVASGVTAASFHGWSWQPASTEEITFLVDGNDASSLAVGDIIIGATSGAVGVVTVADDTSATDAPVTVRVLDGIFQAGEQLNDTAGADTGQDIANPAAFEMTQIPSLTIGVNEDGTLKKMSGARGTFALSAELGQPAFLNFNFRGLKEDAVDAALLVPSTATWKVPPVFLGATFRVGQPGDATVPDTTTALEHTPHLLSFGVDMGATVELRRDATEAIGLFDSAHIVGRQSTGTIAIEVEPEAKFAWLDSMVDGVPVRVRCEWGSEASDNRFIVSAPGATLTGETSNDQNGFGAREFAFTAASRRYTGVDADEAELVISYMNDATVA